MPVHTAVLFACPSAPLDDWTPPQLAPLSYQGQSALALCIEQPIPNDKASTLLIRTAALSRRLAQPQRGARHWLAQILKPELQWLTIARLPLGPGQGKVTAHWGPGGWYVQALGLSSPWLTLSGEPGRSLPLPRLGTLHPLPIDMPPGGPVPGLGERIRLLQRGSLQLTLSLQAQELALLGLLRDLGLQSAAPLFALQHDRIAPE